MYKNNKKEELPPLALEAALQADLLRDIFAALPVGIAWTADDSDRIVYVNRKFSEIFGYRLDDLSTVEQWISSSYADPGQASLTREFWQGRKATAVQQEQIDSLELAIRCKDGQVKTVLSSKIRLPQGIGALSTFLDITPRKQQENIIRRQAEEDPLTGVFNRRAFSGQLADSIKACRASGGRMALMLIDMDNFKSINDSFGHARGDAVLRDIAERLQEAVRDRDCLSRHGGDEFCVILNGLESRHEAEEIARRMLAVLKAPFSLDVSSPVPVQLGASMGLALYPEDGRDEDALLASADQALYRAKAAGKGCFR